MVSRLADAGTKKAFERNALNGGRELPCPTGIKALKSLARDQPCPLRSYNPKNDYLPLPVECASASSEQMHLSNMREFGCETRQKLSHLARLQA